jgi:hypothetical protein
MSYISISINGSWCNAVLGINEVASNVTVRGAICQPMMIMTIVFNYFLHNPIGMNEGPADH